EEAPSDRNVGDVGFPHLVRPLDRLCPGAGFVVLGFSPSAAIPILRQAREQLVDPPHQPEIVVIGRTRRPVDPGAGKPEQLALSADLGLTVVAVNERSTVRGAHLPGLLAKKNLAPRSAGQSWHAASRSRVRDPTPHHPARAFETGPGDGA